MQKNKLDWKIKLGNCNIKHC